MFFAVQKASPKKSSAGAAAAAAACGALGFVLRRRPSLNCIQIFFLPGFEVHQDQKTGSQEAESRAVRSCTPSPSLRRAALRCTVVLCCLLNQHHLLRPPVC